ncbi:MAG: transcription antitermination factor NusB [Acidobacteriota bacterium]
MTRHRAREAALQMLYAWEVGRSEPDQAIAGWTRLGADDAPLSEEGKKFAEDLVRGTIANLGEIDRLIERHAEHWRPSRMAAIDRLILRLAAYELTSGSGVPAAVVINEALELARSFSEPDAVGFVNGILDAVHKAGASGPDRGPDA